MTVTELKNLKTQYHGMAFLEYNVFFAFGNDQLEKEIANLKSKGVLKDDFKLASIGNGGFLPYEKLEPFKKEIERINKWYRFQIENLTPKDREDYILYELKNYECFYINDITDALDVLLPLGFKAKEVQKVFSKAKR